MTVPTDQDIVRLQDDLRKHMTESLRDIPYVRDAHLHCTPYPDHFTISFGLHGWSPTLHAIGISQSENMQRTQASIDELQIAFRRRIDEVAIRQHDRATDAAALGYDAALPIDVFDHIHVDKALPSMRAEDPAACRKVVAEALYRAHGRLAQHAGWANIKASDVLVYEGRETENSPWCRVCAPYMQIRSPEGRRQGKVHGFKIELEAGHLPETALVALVGRPLGSLVRINPVLDMRTIVSVANRSGSAGDGLVVMTQMDVDPIDVVLGEPERLAVGA